MAISDLYKLAKKSNEDFIQYTGLSRQEFLQVLTYFETPVAKNHQSKHKLFAICYALKHNLTGTAIGKELFSANYKRDGENFLEKAGRALEDAKNKASLDPQQEIKPEVVPQQSEDATSTRSENESYLGLPDTQADYILTHAPLNSSGDIYHILAYLILCTHFQKKVPQVMLTYDAPTTEKQANRGHYFAQSLSYASFFRTEQIERKGYRPNARQARLREHLEKHYPDVAYVDQMATTTIIAKLFLQHGFKTITEILQQGFSKYDNQYFPEGAQQEVKGYVKEQLAQLNQDEANKPIVVLHIRYAKSANNRLNIPDDLVVKLISFLSEKGYDAWCVLADDRKNLPGYPSRYTSSPFSPPPPENNSDYSKFKHLELMTAMAKHHLVQGVIGNTSGTLDACAFVGNRVYNIHQFNEKLVYQDIRLTMQLTFLSAEDLRKKSSSSKRTSSLEEKIRETLPNFVRWLIQNKEQTPSIQYEKFETSVKKFEIPVTKRNIEKMYHVFMSNERRALPDIEQFVEIVNKVLQGEDSKLIHRGKRF